MPSAGRVRRCPGGGGHPRSWTSRCAEDDRSASEDTFQGAKARPSHPPTLPARSAARAKRPDLFCPTVWVCLPGRVALPRTRPPPAGSCSTGWPGTPGIRVGRRASAAASTRQHLPRRGLPPGRRRRAGVVWGQPRRPAGPGRDAGAVPAGVRLPRPGKQEVSVHCPGSGGAAWGGQSLICSVRSHGGKPTASGSTPCGRRLPISALPPAKSACRCAGYARNWSSAPDRSPDEPSLDAC